MTLRQLRSNSTKKGIHVGIRKRTKMVCASEVTRWIIVTFLMGPLDTRQPRVHAIGPLFEFHLLCQTLRRIKANGAHRLDFAILFFPRG